MGKKIPMWQCLVVILAMLAFLLWEIVICKDGEGHLALICAAIVAAIVAVANGWKWNYLEQGIIMAISRSMQAMLILMMVGLLIGSWIPGGVIPSLIYYGLKVLNPTIFLFAGCLLCCTLIGVGMGLGINPAMTAEALSVAENTVTSHNYRLYKKLGVENRVQAVNLIREGGKSQP